MNEQAPRWRTGTGTANHPKAKTTKLSPTRPGSNDSAISIPVLHHGHRTSCNIQHTAHAMDEDRPKVLGIHHLKFAVSNLDVSIAWYERVLGAKRVAALDHHRPDGSRFAVVLEMFDWGKLYLELRHTKDQAAKQRGWDPVTLAVNGKSDLEHWLKWLDRWGTMHSQVLTGPRGWIMVFEDPDARRIRMYTRESHGGMEEPSIDQYWLAEL